MAEIWMVFGAEEYKYGTYRFVTRAEKNRVNDLAMQIRKERGCETYVKEMLAAYVRQEESRRDSIDWSLNGAIKDCKENGIDWRT